MNSPDRQGERGLVLSEGLQEQYDTEAQELRGVRRWLCRGVATSLVIAAGGIFLSSRLGYEKEGVLVMAVGVTTTLVLAVLVRGVEMDLSLLPFKYSIESLVQRRKRIASSEDATS